MTVTSGGSVTSCVRTVLGRTIAAVQMDTFWSRVISAKPMCQVQQHATALLSNMLVWCLKSQIHTIKETVFCFSAGLPQLIFTNGGDVMMADIHGRFVRTLVPSQGRGYAVGVAYNIRSNIVFWSDTYTKKVSLVNQ